MSYEVAEQIEKLREALAPSHYDQRIVQIIPGGGWIEVYYDPDADEVWPTPLVAWALTADGTIRPMSSDSYGDVDEALDGNPHGSRPRGFLHPPGEALDLEAARNQCREQHRRWEQQKRPQGDDPPGS